jgi:hypothetical protein
MTGTTTGGMPPSLIERGYRVALLRTGWGPAAEVAVECAAVRAFGKSRSATAIPGGESTFWRTLLAASAVCRPALDESVVLPELAGRLDDLGPLAGDVLALDLTSGLSFSEIAEVVGCAPRVAAALLHLAHARLHPIRNSPAPLIYAEQ